MLYYVTQTSKIDAACLRLKGEPQGRIEQESKDWRKQFNQLQQVMITADGQVKNEWRNQAKNNDIPRHLRNYHYRSNQQFSAGLRGYLREKYYWRDWIVISYNQVGTFDKHCVGGADTWPWFRQQGRNLVVASVPDYKSISRSTSTSGWCRNVRDYRNRARSLNSTISNRASAKVVVESYNSLSVSTDNPKRLFRKNIFNCNYKRFDVLLFF